MQKTRFGLALDGQSGWLSKDAVGESTVDPLGMLTALEPQLGLLRMPVSQAERVVQYSISGASMVGTGRHRRMLRHGCSK